MKNMKILASALFLLVGLTGTAFAAETQIYENFNNNLFSPGAPSTYGQTKTAGTVDTTTSVPAGNILKLKGPSNEDKVVMGTNATTTTNEKRGSAVTYVLRRPYDMQTESRYKATGVMFSGKLGVPPAPILELTGTSIKIGGVIRAMNDNVITVSSLGGRWNISAENGVISLKDLQLGDYVIIEGEGSATSSSMFNVR